MAYSNANKINGAGNLQKFKKCLEVIWRQKILENVIKTALFFEVSLKLFLNISSL